MGNEAREMELGQKDWGGLTEVGFEPTIPFGIGEFPEKLKTNLLNHSSIPPISRNFLQGSGFYIPQITQFPVRVQNACKSRAYFTDEY